MQRGEPGYETILHCALEEKGGRGGGGGGGGGAKDAHPWR